MIKHNQDELTTTTFLDFTSFEELTRQPDILVGLIKNYAKIFSEPDVWAEHYSYEEILNKLQHELSGCAAMRLCIDKASHEVIGFCWAQLLNADEIITAIESVHFYQQKGSPRIGHQLHKLIGNKPIIYIQDLGIGKSHRSRIPLEQLICPVLENVANRALTRTLFFWSVADTCVAWLAHKIGIDVALTLGKMQFFSGELPILENITSVASQNKRSKLANSVSIDSIQGGS